MNAGMVALIGLCVFLGLWYGVLIPSMRKNVRRRFQEPTGSVHGELGDAAEHETIAAATVIASGIDSSHH